SMSAYAQTALRLAVAMAAASSHVEVFTFSTALRRVTPGVRLAAAGRATRLERLETAWGGGTDIGASLRAFLRTAGDRLLRRDTVVIIVSDGLDVGEPSALRDAMRELYRRSAGVVWLNPLLETPGYEPTASGMRAARPYVTTFTSVSDAGGLARLARVARVRS
ncbi:MAG TPA: VWA domain-containing protein, partial [Vicinamibacterales bacterium]|nr:VWA domain-containing protein [Vicinamibacterales bacterium]